jgi:hypothetical protein
LLQLIFDILVLSEWLRRCESTAFHCVSQATIPFICSFINWLVLSILNIDPLKLIIKDFFFFLITAEVNHFEICLSCGVKWRVSTFIDICLQHAWSLILL